MKWVSEKSLQAKKEIVEEIKSKIEKAESVVLVDYRGLNVEQLTELRKRYREANVDYKVYKNTMMRFAFKDAGYEGFEEYKGPSAIAFGYDDQYKWLRLQQSLLRNMISLKSRLV